MLKHWWMGGLAALALIAALLTTAAFQPVSAFAADPSQPQATPTAATARDRIAGHVTAVDNQAFTLQTLKQDSVRVHWDAQTTCTFDDGSRRTDCGQIAAGDPLVAAGRLPGDSDQFLARRIVVAPPIVVGHVTAVDGATLTLQTHGGDTKTVAYEAGTTCVEAGQPIDCATIAVGDRIAAAGDLSANASGGTLVAKRIRVLRQRVAGTVTAADGGTLTLQPRSGGSATVALLSTTQCYENTQPVDCSTIAVGDHVGAVGLVASGVLQAQKVLEVTKLPAVRGVVQSADGHVIVVAASDGTTYHVHWDASTQCDSGRGPVDCGTIAAGDHAAVRGADLGGNNVQATRILFRAPREPSPVATPAVTPGA